MPVHDHAPAGFPSRFRLAALLLCATALIAAPAARSQEGNRNGSGAGLRFGLPVDCAIGRDCHIQNFFDHDPGPGRVDYACGRLSYDGHTGTDFRVADLPAMERGVPVVAAAAGTVRGVRDGMPDVNVRDIDPAAIKGREAGNGVVIDHGGGWQTQYSHLRRGSVAVRPGDRVEAGQRLGLIGHSGMAEFPHVEFVVRHDGKPVDPFVGDVAVGDVAFPSCGDRREPRKEASLWAESAAAVLSYQPSGGLSAGFAAGPAKAESARQGAYGDRFSAAGTPALVLWADVFGVLAGDEQRFRIEGPDGRELFAHGETIKESKVAWFGFAGRKRPPEGWAPGAYRGTYTLTRDGKEVVRLERTAELR